MQIKKPEKKIQDSFQASLRSCINCELCKFRSLRRSFLHFHFISAVHIWLISYIINTKTKNKNKNIKFINGQVRITVNFILYRILTFLVSGTYWLKDQVVTLAADDGVVSIFQAKTLLKRRVNAVNLNKSWNSITLGGYPSIKMNSNSNKNTLKRHYNVSWKW